MASVEQVDGLIKQVTSFKDEDISHPELGTVSGFQQAQTAKEAVARYLLDLLAAIRDVVGYADDSMLDHVLDEIGQLGRQLASIIEEINKLAKGDVHTQQFPAQRDAQIGSFQERVQNFKRNFQAYEATIRAVRLERTVNASHIATIAKEAEAKLQKADGLLSQAVKALENVQTKAMVKAVETAAASFDKLRKAHAIRESWWFGGFLVSAAATVYAIAYVALPEWTATELPEIVAAVFRKALIITMPAVFMRVTLAKYNLERNLRIIYDHRETVLAQYRTFETAIGDDAPAKNQFRLEIAKYIFSDPVTGYITQEAGAEINVNPVVGMIEKIAGK